MSLNSEKLQAFAKQVGIDYAELKKLVDNLTSTMNGKASTSEITQAVDNLKNELLNGVGVEYDTFKELADKLTELADGTGVGELITQKLAEINKKFTELEQLDLLGAYNLGKTGG